MNRKIKLMDYFDQVIGTPNPDRSLTPHNIAYYANSLSVDRPIMHLLFSPPQKLNSVDSSLQNFFLSIMLSYFRLCDWLEQFNNVDNKKN